MQKLSHLCLLVLLITGCSSEEQKIQKIVPEITSSGEFNGFIQVQSFGKEPFTYSHQPNQSGLPIIHQDTPLYLASLTKLFTEVMIYRLVDEELLYLSKTISDYRKDFKPSFGNKIKIQHLLDMKSGLPRELDPENLTGVKYNDFSRAGMFLDEIPNLDLAYEPGTNESYSNLNYWLLGAIIEEVTETNVEEAFNAYLFEPLEMNSSGLIMTDKKPVSGFLKEGNAWLKDENSYVNRYTSGGFFSTANDLARLVTALDKENVLSEQSLNLLLGEDERLEVFGSLPGYSNMLLWDRKNQFSVIALNNVGLPDLNKMTELQKGIYNIFGIATSTGQGSNNRIQVVSVDSLSTSVKLERVMAQWIKAIQEEDEDALFSILEPVSNPGSFQRTDATWSEIIKAKQSMENFRVAGYRWVEDEMPKGIEVWFISDTEAKIGFLLIPSDENPDVISNLMVKPVDTIWMGRQF
ncbi:MAG: serine hydrolase domain-containing protein [Balneola sp.]